MTERSEPYTEYAPPTDLRAIVACTWVARAGAREASPSPIIPDACSDIVVVGAAAPHVAGPATRTHEVSAEPGTIVVGIRFKPGAARAVFGCDASELRDADVELHAVGLRDTRHLVAALDSAQSPHTMRAALESWVRARLSARADRDAIALHAARALVVDPQLTVHGLARSLGWSERRLLREISATCGYGPKMLQRIVRVQRVVRRARGDCSSSLATLAVDAGYADQAHMTREFRDLTGLTPRTLLARSRADVGR